jgi:outer membrane protein
MKKIILIATLVFSNISFYAVAENNKIAVVDIQQVLEESTAAKDVKSQIKEKRDHYQTEITTEEDKLRQAEKKLSEQRAVLSKDAFEQKTEEFKEKLIVVQREVQEKRANLDSLLTNSLGKIQKSVFEIIEDISKEEGFDIAIPTSQILYANEKLNITTEVLKRLNKKMPSLKISEE